MRIKVSLAAIALIAMSVVSTFGQTWDLSGDWSWPNNPNGPWLYGQIVSGTFVPLSPTAANQYGDYTTTGAFIYKNTVSYLAYGIDPNHVSLECDFGTPALEWVTPVSGFYLLNVNIGGTRSVDGGGSGNAHAASSVLSLNWVDQTGSYDSSGNIISWNLSGFYLNAGDILETYIPENYGSGNTQTQITITSIAPAPEPSVVVLSGLGLAVLLLRRKMNY